VLEYPQSGEHIKGRHNIQASRVAQPNSGCFKVQCIVGSGELWVTEFVLAYDGRPSYSVSFMEFQDGMVARETQYLPTRSSPDRAYVARCCTCRFDVEQSAALPSLFDGKADRLKLAVQSRPRLRRTVTSVRSSLKI
jgi:hypothetical protein